MSSIALLPPSEAICLSENQARTVIEHGLYTCKRLEGFAKQLCDAMMQFSGHLHSICLQERTKACKIVREQAAGVAELWNTMQTLTGKMADSQTKAADGLMEEFAKPLERMQVYLQEQRLCLDEIRCDRSVDSSTVECNLGKDRQICAKALTALQNSVKSLTTTPGITSGVFSKMSRHLHKRGINKKIADVQDLFRKYEVAIEAYNRQLTNYEEKVHMPVLHRIWELESDRCEMLRECSLHLKRYLNSIINPDDTTMCLFDNIVKSVTRARDDCEGGKRTLSEMKLSFAYDLPCRPEAFDNNTWPGCPDIWSRKSLSSRVEGGISRPWMEGITSDEDNHDLSINAEFEPCPIETPLQFVEPKLVEVQTARSEPSSNSFSEKLAMMEKLLNTSSLSNPSPTIVPMKRGALPGRARQRSCSKSEAFELPQLTLDQPLVSSQSPEGVISRRSFLAHV